MSGLLRTELPRKTDETAAGARPTGGFVCVRGRGRYFTAPAVRPATT